MRADGSAEPPGAKPFAARSTSAFPRHGLLDVVRQPAGALPASGFGRPEIDADGLVFGIDGFAHGRGIDIHRLGHAGTICRPRRPPCLGVSCHRHCGHKPRRRFPDRPSAPTAVRRPRETPRLASPRQREQAERPTCGETQAEGKGHHPDCRGGRCPQSEGDRARNQSGPAQSQ